jgi:membrane associated rhomboid family serine protease
MLYDRSYMKASPTKPNRLSALAWILISLLGVYVMQKLVSIFAGEAIYRSAVEQFFALSGDGIRSGRIWTLLTYGFLHDTRSIAHILFNGLGLFFIGRMVQELYGDRKLVEIFLLSAITGGVLGALVHFNSNTIIVGASGALMGLLTVFCLTKPNQEITLLLYFILPLRVKPKWILWVSLGFSIIGLLFQELPGTNPVAHSAHLGGMIGGAIYFYLFSRSGSFSDLLPKIKFSSTEIVKPTPKKASKVGYSVNLSNREKLKAEVDRILDKINEEGFGSLTAEERSTLDKARDLL